MESDPACMCELLVRSRAVNIPGIEDVVRRAACILHVTANDQDVRAVGCVHS